MCFSIQGGLATYLPAGGSHSLLHVMSYLTFSKCMDYICGTVMISHCLSYYNYVH